MAESKPVPLHIGVRLHVTLGDGPDATRNTYESEGSADEVATFLSGMANTLSELAPILTAPTVQTFGGDA